MITELKPYPELEGSGVDWLGELPAHWQARKLRSLYRRHGSGTTPAGDHYFGGGVPWIMSGDLNDGVLSDTKRTVTQRALHEVRALKIYPAHSLVIAMYGATIGRTGILSVEACTNQACCVLADPTRDANTVYFQLVLNTARPHLVHCSFGGGQPNINAEIVRALRVPVPPLPEQTAIVRFLNHADRRIRRYIRAKQKLIALLEEQKQAIIHQAVTGQVDVRTGQPYPAYKPSGVEWLGDVPAHWNGTSLGAASHSIQTGPFGSQLHASDYVSEGIPVINPSHMRNGDLVPDPSISITQQKAGELSRHRLQPHDIVMARRGEVGRCALVTDVETDWLCGTGSLRIRPRFQTFVPAYLLLVLNAPGTRDALSLSSIGATMNNLNAGIVSKLTLTLPSLPEQTAIVEHIDEATADIDGAICRTRRHVSLLREYRTRLIADVVTGKIDVHEAAAALPEVDPLAAEDCLDDTIDTAAEPDLDELDATLEEAEA